MNSALDVIRKLLSFLMTIIILVGILFLILLALGITPYIVRSGSMEPALKTGSLVFVNHKSKYENIKNNDILAYKVSSGEVVTHRVINVYDDGIETKGDANLVSDGISTTKENYSGKVIFSIPKLGYIFSVFGTKRGKIVLGTFIVLILTVGLLFGK